MKDYNAMIDAVIPAYNDDPDFGRSTPTDHARDLFVGIMSQITSQLEPVISISPEGGLRADWMYPHHSVRLIVTEREDKQSIVFFESPNRFAAWMATADNLNDRLAWLAQEVGA